MEDIVKQDMIGAFSATSIEEQTTSSDAGQYVQPQVWAKDKKSWRSVSDPDFPMYGGPGGEYVKVKNKCRTFPYCNQGDVDALDFYSPVKKKKNKKSKNKLTPFGRRKRKIAKDLVRTQKIKTPRGKHYNIGRRISESNRYLYYNDELTQREVDQAILENTMKKKIKNQRTRGVDLENSIKKELNFMQEQKAFKDAQGGYKVTQKMHAESGVSNTEGVKLAAEKIKKFMKDDNGMALPTPPMHRNTTAQDEYVEDINYSSGQTGLRYAQPLSDETKDRHEKYLKGSQETGNAVKGKEIERVGPGGGVSNVMTKNSEGGANTAGEMLSKSAKRRRAKEDEGNRLANNNRRYTPDTVTTTNKPVVKLGEHVIETGEQILPFLPNYLKKDGQEFTVTSGDVIKECKYENFIGQQGGQVIITNNSNPSELTEQMTRMKELFSYNSGKKHDTFR